MGHTPGNIEIIKLIVTSVITVVVAAYGVVLQRV
jgi:hypothetical protein